MIVTRTSLWELVMPFVYVALVWFATLAGWFALPQGMLYDAAVRLTPPGGDAGQELLIVEADLSLDQRNNDGAAWANALDILQKNEAAQILFLFMPKDEPPAFYERVAAMDNVRFGRRVISGEEPVLEPVPAAGRGNIGPMFVWKDTLSPLWPGRRPGLFTGRIMFSRRTGFSSTSWTVPHCCPKFL